MNKAYTPQRGPVQSATDLFARDAAAFSYTISRLIAELDRDAKQLVGADRLKVKAMLDSLAAHSCDLLIWSKRVQQGILPR